MAAASAASAPQPRRASKRQSRERLLLVAALCSRARRGRAPQARGEPPPASPPSYAPPRRKQNQRRSASTRRRPSSRRTFRECAFCRSRPPRRPSRKASAGFLVASARARLRRFSSASRTFSSSSLFLVDARPCLVQDGGILQGEHHGLALCTSSAPCRTRKPARSRRKCTASPRRFFPAAVKDAPSSSVGILGVVILLGELTREFLRLARSASRRFSLDRLGSCSPTR